MVAKIAKGSVTQGYWLNFKAALYIFFCFSTKTFFCHLFDQWTRVKVSKTYQSE